jgi:hypothetical protein
MRISRHDRTRIAGSRYGFVIADLVLRDTVEEFAEGEIEQDELALALSQHRQAYEGYVRELRQYVEPRFDR